MLDTLDGLTCLLPLCLSFSYNASEGIKSTFVLPLPLPALCSPLISFGFLTPFFLPSILYFSYYSNPRYQTFDASSAQWSRRPL